MKDVEKELFDLLKLSLWSRSDPSLQQIDGEEVMAERLRNFSWRALFRLAKEQCVIGLTADVLASCKGKIGVPEAG